jgi:hypothetical protein
MMDKIELYKPKELMIQLRGANTPVKCIKSDAKVLAVIKKDIGEKELNKLIKVWIADLNDFLNISRKMSLPQAEQTATMIISDFYYMNMADINLVFTRAKKGYYGALYESLDGMKIYSWFEKYANERAQAAYDDKLNKDSIIKERR